MAQVGDLNSSGPTLTPLLTVGGLSWESPPNVRRGVRGPPCQLADSQLYLGPLSYCSTVVLPSNPNPNPSGEGGSIGSSRPWANHLPDRSRFQRVLKCHQNSDRGNRRVLGPREHLQPLPTVFKRSRHFLRRPTRRTDLWTVQRTRRRRRRRSSVGGAADPSVV